ncbi:MarR family winged helix-turn-helix transcriptional regulator [Sphingomonas sp. DG1-23]|uniref:MarR family winged helix-turn-helix transcriptional regulator n=1 Tax=Sphingomonas sp. DG1-23 TaxID=3068316 RepID=UPI00273E70D6|nr:MarR family winged helix-turn-helix transcriptional regulator [Sphingomonas sp. DG1-23]MDP5280593.1 MarR family winged helix-turn-helix transcriptional regulator [Sphingomonas sp. DG1-23]
MYMHHDSIQGPCVCTALRKAARAVSRVYDEALAGHAMSTAQFAILRHVGRGEPLALSRLAEQLEMDRTSLYRALAPLEARDWISIAPGPGKSRLASLTAAGCEAMHDAEDDWRRVQTRITGAMGDAQWATLESALRTITSLARQESH